MKIRRGSLYMVGLNPQAGTEAGKIRPVLVIQTDFLNEVGHPTTWVLPCTTRLSGENLLRVPIPRGAAGNRAECEIMIDQSRTVDNRRFVRPLKPLPNALFRDVESKLRRLADL